MNHLTLENFSFCALPEDTVLMKLRGELMSGPVDGIYIGPQEVRSCFSVGVPLIAPQDPGQYKVYWSCQSAGKFFGDVFCIDIEVLALAQPVISSMFNRSNSDEWSIVSHGNGENDQTFSNIDSHDSVYGSIEEKADVAFRMLQCVNHGSTWPWTALIRNELNSKKVKFAEKLGVLAKLGLGCGFNSLTLFSSGDSYQSTDMDKIASELLSNGNLHLTDENAKYFDILRIFCEHGVIPDNGSTDYIESLIDLIRSTVDLYPNESILSIARGVLCALTYAAKDCRNSELEELFKTVHEELLVRWSKELESLAEMGFVEQNGRLTALLEQYIKFPGAPGIEEVIPILLSDIQE